MKRSGYLRARTNNISIQTLRALTLKGDSLFISVSTGNHPQLESVCEQMVMRGTNNAKREKRSVFVDVEHRFATHEKQLLATVELYPIRHISNRKAT